MEASGQKRHGWLHVLLWSAAVFACIISAATSVIPDSLIDGPDLPISLQQWGNIAAFASTDALKAFKRGVALYQDKRFAAALEALPDEQAPGIAAIGDYLLLHRGKANASLERYRDAIADFKRLESRYTDSPLLQEALREQCRILLTLKDVKPALAILANPRIGTGAEIVYYQARAAELAGERDKALEQYLQIYSQHPASKYSATAEKYILASSKGALLGTRHYDARLQRAESLIRSGDFKTARLMLQALGRVAAPGILSSEKRNLLYGEVQYRTGKASLAIPFFRKVSSANAALHARALYLEALCSRKLERERDFLALRDRMLKAYPRSSEAEEICYSAATYFDVQYSQAKSRDAYAVLYEAFPKGRYAGRALWKLALASYLDKNYAEAALGFWKYLTAYPDADSAGPAMYWMGRCYQKLGGTWNAKYLFGRARMLGDESYYGQRAREAESALGKTGITLQVPVAGIDFAQVVSTCDGIRLPPVGFAEPEAPGIHVLTRAKQLAAAGLTDLSLAELRAGRNRYPQHAGAFSYAMSRIYMSRGDYYESIASLRSAVPDYNLRPVASLPSEIWEVLYPVRYSGTVAEQAAAREVDPALVMGLIRQESAFEEKAKSKANARGLMQILPSTGRTLARGLKGIRYTPQILYHAETNIALGTRFLDSLLREYGKPELALAAYNAGKSRVDRWLEEWSGYDMTEFVELIPFAETRGYVKQVLSNKARYGLLVPSIRR